jgi:hypothetical protein
MRSFEQLSDPLLRRLLSSLRAELVLRHGPALCSLVLFGSRARGDAGPQSDIDLLLVAANPRHPDGLAGVREPFEQGGDYRAWVAQRGTPAISLIALTPAAALESRYLYLDLVEDAVFVYDHGDFMRRKLQAVQARLRELGSYRVHFADGSHLWILKPGFRLGETVEF